MAKPKAKPPGKKVLDKIGNLVAFSPVWAGGVPFPVSVEFDTPAQQHNFLNATSVAIQYEDLTSGKSSVWPRAMNLTAASQAPFTVSVTFTPYDPNTASASLSGLKKALHGTGSGTIVYTDAIGTHQINGTLTPLYNLATLTQTEFLKIFVHK